MKRKALVTGATGFIGRKLCETLKRKGYTVIAHARSTDAEGPWDTLVSFDLEADIVPCDIFSGVDTVFHLAGKAHALSEKYGQDDGSYNRINVDGTRKLLECAAQKGVRAFVFFSSVKVLGEGGDSCLDDDSPVSPKTPYAVSKLVSEEMLLNGDYVRHPVVLRLSMVYGPDNKGNLFRMINAVKRGYFPPLGKVSNRRSMVHVDDVTHISCIVAEEDIACGKTYIVTDGNYYSTGEIYGYIRNALGLKPVYVSVPIVILKIVARFGDVFGAVTGRRFPVDSHSLMKLIGSECYDNTRLKNELGYVPEHGLKASLIDMVDSKDR